MSDDAARDAYYAYGVDLIRTAGLLLRTTPSVIYRASMLFQRFEASVDTHFRAHYIKARDMAAYRQTLDAKLALAERLALQPLSPQVSTQMSATVARVVKDSIDDDGVTPLADVPSGVEYFIPNHAQQEMRTGLVPLVDLRAPLDYCLHHLIDQEDIVYLGAACLLIATKMEDPAIRIRAVVNTCMRLSERRAGVVVNELQKPPPARYEDFKACVVDAEEVVLHQLGFQTFVESPYKYELLYLNLLVEPTGEAGQDVAATAAAAASFPSTRVTSARPHSSALTQWMVRAVQLANDFPRCRHLLHVASDVLALYAIQQTCPPDLTLPPNWTDVFGVNAVAVAEVAHAYAAYLKDGIGSRRATAALSDLRAQNTVAPYRTVKEGVEYESAMKGLADLRRATAARGSERLSHSSPPAPPRPSLPVSTSNFSRANRVGEAASPTPPTAASIEELRDLIGASLPPPLLGGGKSRVGRNDAQSLDHVAKRSRGEPR